MLRVRKAASTWEASSLMGLRVSAGKNLLTNISLDTRRSKSRSSRGVGGGCRGRRAATTDQGAVGGGGGSIVFPAAGAARGAVKPAEVAGAWCGGGAGAAV